MAKKKTTAKALSQQKRHRRQWVTFMRMCRYGINNFTRNAWLTIAATAVMTITLYVIFLSVVIQNVVQDTGTQISDDVDMSVYLATDTAREQVDAVAAEISELPSVNSLRIETPDQARTNQAQQFRDNPEALSAISEANNQYPWTIKVKVADINDTSDLRTYTSESELYQQYADERRAPSFAGERREAIENIGRIVAFARNLGIGASLVFVIIATLIIFNTIRMAIFNRRDEIQMMKLIGAERSFIRGPFIVEAVVYGFIAALIATVGGYATLHFAAPSLMEYEINISPTMNLVTYYIGFVLLGMIVIGAIIGIFSSLLATRRYLKL
jgi:cell division transport system permease protein